MENNNCSSSHAVFNLKLHIVFVAKYRRKTLTPELLETVRAYVDAQGTEEHTIKKVRAL
jgi:putative transposase